MPMERAGSVIDGSFFGGEVRRAKLALKFDPTLKAAGSLDLSHQQEMVKLDHQGGS